MRYRIAGLLAVLLVALLSALPLTAGSLRPFTLWQLKNQTRSQMMSYVIRTAGGHLIVIDGGTAGDAPHLGSFLARWGNHVSLWFVTHPHSDHVGALGVLLENPGKLRIDGLYGSQPTAQWMAQYAPQADRKEYDRFCAALTASGRRLNELSLGQQLTLDGLVFEVLGVRNPELTANPVNNQSILLRLTGAGRTVLFTGDLGVEGGRKALASPYADRLHADYVQMAHHGQNGVEEAFYRHVGASCCLWPTPQWLWDNDRGGGRGSGPWRTLIVREWMERLGVKRHHVMCLDGELVE